MNTCPTAVAVLACVLAAVCCHPLRPAHGQVNQEAVDRVAAGEVKVAHCSDAYMWSLRTARLSVRVLGGCGTWLVEGGEWLLGATYDDLVGNRKRSPYGVRRIPPSDGA